MIEELKGWWKQAGEWRLAIAALALWLVVGLALAPFTATVGLDFVHKITVGLFRIAVSVALTFAEVKLVFPTICAWEKAGGFRDAWNSDRADLKTLERLRDATLVHTLFFVGTVVAFSL